GDGLALRLPANLEEQLAQSLWSLDLSRLLPAVHQPVAMIAASGPHRARDKVDGTDDQPTPLRAMSVSPTSALLPGGLTVCAIPGGHHLPLQHPHAVAAAIEGFISQMVHNGHAGVGFRTPSGPGPATNTGCG